MGIRVNGGIAVYISDLRIEPDLDILSPEAILVWGFPFTHTHTKQVLYIITDNFT